MNDKRKGGAPPVANQFALGYTYLDVLDADHEGVLPFCRGWNDFFEYWLTWLRAFFRYPGACVRLSPFRALLVLCTPPQATLDPTICPGDPGRDPAGLVRPVDMGPEAEGVGPSVKARAGLA